jgi:uncharacterized protein YbjT (DUF2867 family)
MKKILVAGGTGYLGQFVIRELFEQGYEVTAIARSPRKLDHLKPFIHHIIDAELSDIEALEKAMVGMDGIFSSVGITRQKDGLTYMDVDYGYNRNLLNAALVAGVKKFMYIGILNGPQFRILKGIDAKERFTDELIEASIESYVIRPSGFFSDMTEIYHMAKKGRVYLFGKGDYKANPIHGKDLAQFCVEKLEKGGGVFPVGGPEVLSQNQIVNLAFKALNKKSRITRIPEWTAHLAKWLLRHLTKESFYGPIEFFLTVLLVSMEAPTYGEIGLGDYYMSIANRDKEQGI